MLISVVIPVYNAQKTISRCIQSILRQTEKNLEIIAVNDGSTDSSGKILDRLAHSDSRIRVIHQENQGSVAARRNGVMNASGDYICFCDADDTMPPDAIELLLKQSEKSDSDICTGKSVKKVKGIRINGHSSPLLSDQ